MGKFIFKKSSKYMGSIFSPWLPPRCQSPGGPERQPARDTKRHAWRCGQGGPHPVQAQRLRTVGRRLAAEPRMQRMTAAFDRCPNPLWCLSTPSPCAIIRNTHPYRGSSELTGGSSRHSLNMLGARNRKSGFQPFSHEPLCL